MKTTGITRRIDELGRIVIPKEIRSNLHLKSGELLEIYLQDSESIMLKKHSIINKKYEILGEIIKSLSKTISSDVYVTNLNEIVFSSNKSTIGDKLNPELDEILGNVKALQILKNIKLTDKITLEGNFKIYPIIPNGDFSGILIVSNIIDEKDLRLVNFIKSFVEEYLEIN